MSIDTKSLRAGDAVHVRGRVQHVMPDGRVTIDLNGLTTPALPAEFVVHAERRLLKVGDTVKRIGKPAHHTIEAFVWTSAGEHAVLVDRYGVEFADLDELERVS